MAKWNSSQETFKREKEQRQGLADKIIPFGVKFLDDAMRGIAPTDLVVVGAYSGAGKTQFCVNVALSALENEKRVHFFALEAEPAEIERRLKFSFLSRWYHQQTIKPRGQGRPWSYQNWIYGDFDSQLGSAYEVINELGDSFRDLFVYYRNSDFTLETMIDKAFEVKDETDLIILDHIHYIDWEGDDNKALKTIAKHSRDLSQLMGKPIILVSHLRKKDRKAPELCPGLDEFHGSSDITKIATKVITLGSGDMISKTEVETYFSIPKCRLDGSVTRYVGMTVYNFTRGTYEPRYQIGRLKNLGQEFEPIEAENRPDWAAKPVVTGP